MFIAGYLTVFTARRIASKRGMCHSSWPFCQSVCHTQVECRHIIFINLCQHLVAHRSNFDSAIVVGSVKYRYNIHNFRPTIQDTGIVIMKH